MFKGQPKGLFALALANTGERFGYYTMMAIFVLFIQAKFGFSAAVAGQINSAFLAVVYFMPLLGGLLADKIGYGKCVVLGIVVMFCGYLSLTIPSPASTFGLISMYTALALISIGTGLFKGNLQVMVGNLYDDPRYAAKRDSAFSLFYMAINIGAMFAPAAATAISNFFLKGSGLVYNANVPALAHQVLNGSISVENNALLQGIAQEMLKTSEVNLSEFSSFYLEKLSTSYSLGFAVACVSLVASMLIYFSCRAWFKHADVRSVDKLKDDKNMESVETLTPTQEKSRVFALLSVFGVVIFFWMAFHQNSNTLTFFARDYTANSASGLGKMWFKVEILALIAVSVYTLVGMFQADKKKSRYLLGLSTLSLWVVAYIIYRNMGESVAVFPQIFQQFNPFFVVSLTPLSMLLFSYLAKKGKEPSAPKKIGLGMFVAACGFAIMITASLHLLSPRELNGAVSSTLVSPSWLLSTYLVLTFAELLLSPMGISFVSKVAPPKYKGLMMGGWFAATAIGNYLCSIPAVLWDKPLPLWSIWALLAALCGVSALLMFVMLPRLEAATK